MRKRNVPSFPSSSSTRRATDVRLPYYASPFHTCHSYRITRHYPSYSRRFLPSLPVLFGSLSTVQQTRNRCTCNVNGFNVVVKTRAFDARSAANDATNINGRAVHFTCVHMLHSVHGAALCPRCARFSCLSSLFAPAFPSVPLLPPLFAFSLAPHHERTKIDEMLSEIRHTAPLIHGHSPRNTM